MATPQREIRVHGSLLAAAEKRLLIRMAGAMPGRVNSDHLTALGAVAMLGSGVCYAAGARWPPALLLAILCLAINWFGDSLDGTLARVRRHERPRYGFYLDHVLDAVGMLLLVGGLLAGGFVTIVPAAVFAIAYYLLTIEIALATHALGTFRISYWKFGPTELRILLAIGTLQLLNSPWSTIAGHRFLLFDIGLTAGALGIVATFIVSAVSNTRKLYALEPLPILPAEAGSHAKEGAGSHKSSARQTRGFRLQAKEATR
jgi:archaetidylinositol phosphate synthase